MELGRNYVLNRQAVAARGLSFQRQMQTTICLLVCTKARYRQKVCFVLEADRNGEVKTSD